MRHWPWGVLLAALVAAPAWPAPPADYRLAPGDVLEVVVAPQRNFDRTVTVQPDGKISYPVVGQLRAAGLTIPELTESLRAVLNRELVEPRVNISLKELNKNAVSRVSVLGAVRNPGVFEIKEGSTLAETLASAGGPSPIADLRRVIITRTDRTVVTADLAQTGKTGRLDGNVELKPGDLIVIPEGCRRSWSTSPQSPVDRPQRAKCGFERGSHSPPTVEMGGLGNGRGRPGSSRSGRRDE